MCLEDLRLAKGYEVGQSFTISDTKGATNIIPANPNRVALILAAKLSGLGGAITLCLDSATNTPIFTQGDSQSPFSASLTIFNYGQVIQSMLFGGGTGVGSVMTVTELISQVNAPSIGNYKP